MKTEQEAHGRGSLWEEFLLFRDCCTQNVSFFLYHKDGEHAEKKADMSGDQWRDQDDLVMFYR